jgi:hypothetical protein
MGGAPRLRWPRAGGPLLALFRRSGTREGEGRGGGEEGQRQAVVVHYQRWREVGETNGMQALYVRHVWVLT